MRRSSLADRRDQCGEWKRYAERSALCPLRTHRRGGHARQRARLLQLVPAELLVQRNAPLGGRESGAGKRGGGV